MNTIRLNITLPKELGLKLNHLPNKSAFIADALKEMLSKKEREKRLLKLKEAYRQASIEETGIVRDWNQTAGDDL